MIAGEDRCLANVILGCKNRCIFIANESWKKTKGTTSGTDIAVNSQRFLVKMDSPCCLISIPDQSTHSCGFTPGGVHCNPFLSAEWKTVLMSSHPAPFPRHPFWLGPPDGCRHQQIALPLLGQHLKGSLQTHLEWPCGHISERNEIWIGRFLIGTLLALCYMDSAEMVWGVPRRGYADVATLSTIQPLGSAG